jgi:hypothetical protein
MSVKSWYGKRKGWKLNIPNAEMKSLMIDSSAKGKNVFELKPFIKKKKVVYFTVDFEDGALPARWRKVTLFPRGKKPAVLQPPLVLSDQATDVQALTAVATVKKYWKDHLSTTERLEGEIDVDGQRASLTLIQIPKVVNGSKSLLCLFTTFDAIPLGGGAPNPDGTGGGSSVRT